MPRNFGLSRHEGLPAAFDLSRSGYFLDFALVPFAELALIATALWRGLHPAGLVAALLTGAVVWSFAEYWIHRLVFHGPTAFEPMHQMHHALPKDLIGVASLGTFGGFAGIWLIAYILVGGSLCSAATAGFMSGYLFYCAIHVGMHHFEARGFGRYGAMMRRLHAAHHRGGKGNFGVSSPVWDIVFRTYRKA
ncbi:sterol desaturase family protein [uncultured Bradyrhizobium sp.]|uniref:sterol desaturase family protein n=1 Tax=uncultured Bradyrhizobium sp. TaxID=199684 RepID=UPI0035C9C551